MSRARARLPAVTTDSRERTATGEADASSGGGEARPLPRHFSLVRSFTPADFVTLLLPRLADRLPDRARGPLRLEVTADGSLNPELAGRVWVVAGQDPPADPVDVRGPDWAALAWLTGRTSAVGEAMTALPELVPWL